MVLTFYEYFFLYYILPREIQGTFIYFYWEYTFKVPVLDERGTCMEGLDVFQGRQVTFPILLYD